MLREVKTHLINPSTGTIRRKPEMPPKRPVVLLEWTSKGRRGPSVGKNAWRPGGSAHKIGKAIAKNGVAYSFDLVTGKRVNPQGHSIESRAGRRSEDTENKARRLVEKANKGGLTAHEMDRLMEYGARDCMVQHGNLARLISTILFDPSRPRPDAGRVITHRGKHAVAR